MKKLITSTFIRIGKTNILANFLNLSVIQIINALSQIYIYYLINSILGLETFGKVIVASTFCGVAGSIINYGTNQSGIREVSSNIGKTTMSRVISNILWIRIILFIAYLMVLGGLSYFNSQYFTLIIFSLPLILAEVLNPLYFYIGIEKLKYYNLFNMLSKLISIIAVLLLIKNEYDDYKVNFIIGSSGVLIYGLLLVSAFRVYKLKLLIPRFSILLYQFKDNFYLTVNNLSVQLQQSLMVFALGKWGEEIVLGAYSFCDKLLWGGRLLIMAISNAIYPKGVQLYNERPELWFKFRFKFKIIITTFFILASIIMYFFPDYIILILTNTQEAHAINFIKAMALVPTVAALNSLNVLDLLIKNKNAAVFRISMISLIISIITVFIFVKEKNYMAIAYYALLIESVNLLMYEMAIRKYRNA